MTSRSWTLLDILNQTSAFFLRRGLDNPRLQAELLLADILQLRRVDLYLQFERELTTAEVDAYRAHVRRRVQGVPLQYITGTSGFRQLILSVPEGVLIPRPETEVVTGVALDLLQAADVQVLDLGTGTGAIAVSMAYEHQQVRVVAVDLSPDAVRATRANSVAAGVDQRVQALQGDLYAALVGDQADIRFTLIVSNPPYIPRQDLATLDAEVRDFEPRLALDGGVDGLDLYRRIISGAPDHLLPQGYLVLELGEGQSTAVAALVEACPGLEVCRIHPDLNGAARVLVAQCSGV